MSCECESSRSDYEAPFEAGKSDVIKKGWSNQPPRTTITTSTSSPTSLVVKTAQRDEVDKLREALLLLAQEKGSSGVLEGKYLEQIKRCRTLTVKLEAEKTRAERLERELQEVRAGHGVPNTGGAARHARPSMSHTRGERGGTSQAQPNIEGGSDAAAGGTAITVKALRERLDRAYKQLHEKEAQLEEARRESGQLCTMLMYETGASKQEVLRAAREGIATVEGSTGVSVAGSVPAGSTTAVTASMAPSGQSENRPRIGHGWHSRAAQIILLRGKVKDLERALAEARADTSGEHHDPPTVTATEATGRDSETTAASTPRAAASTTTAAVTGTRTGHVLAAPSAASEARGDVDDAARDHVARLESRRLCTLRELEAALARSEQELGEARHRQAAQQARFQLLQQRSSQLREYVEVILEKSASDDELIAAYKAELTQLQRNALPQLQDKDDGETVDEKDELRSLRRQVRELHGQLAASGEQGCNGKRAVSSDLAPDTPIAVDGRPVTLQEHLQEWVDEACRTLEARASNAVEDGGGGVAMPCLVGAVLRAAHAHVLLVEARLQELERRYSVQLYDRYTRLLDSVGKRLTAAVPEGGGAGKSEDDVVLMRQVATLPPIEPFVLQENKSLKQRVRTLTDMAKKEAVAQRVRTMQQQQS